MQPADEDRVLVAVINRVRDLQIVRTQQWYRIPLEHAPEQLASEYIAFYQTAVFGEKERWSVRYYAPVLRYRITTRRALLPDEAMHPRADAWYYCLHLGPLAMLPLPVPAARLRRVTFIMTTFRNIRRAQDVRDLWRWYEEEQSFDDMLWGTGLAGQSVQG